MATAAGTELVERREHTAHGQTSVCVCVWRERKKREREEESALFAMGRDGGIEGSSLRGQMVVGGRSHTAVTANSVWS